MCEDVESPIFLMIQTLYFLDKIQTGVLNIQDIIITYSLIYIFIYGKESPKSSQEALGNSLTTRVPQANQSIIEPGLATSNATTITPFTLVEIFK